MTAARKIKYLLIKGNRTMKREGMAVLFQKVLRKSKSLAFRTTNSIWFERGLENPVECVRPGIDIQIEFLVEERHRLAEWLKEKDRNFPWLYLDEEMRIADRNGHTFTVIRYGAEIIGYMKIGVNLTYIRDFNKTIRFPEGAAFIYDTFVLPQYRQLHLANFALGKSLEYLTEHNYRKVYCHIEKWNRPSLRLYTKMGFDEIGSIRFSTVFGMQFFLFNSYKPFADIESFVTRIKH
jgi:ribosomal protein S18 acetylase RimI-like enzyme